MLRDGFSFPDQVQHHEAWSCQHKVRGKLTAHEIIIRRFHYQEIFPASGIRDNGLKGLFNDQVICHRAPFMRKPEKPGYAGTRMARRPFLDRGQGKHHHKSTKTQRISRASHEVSLCLRAFVVIFLSVRPHGADRCARVIRLLRFPDFRVNRMCLFWYDMMGHWRHDSLLHGSEHDQ